MNPQAADGCARSPGTQTRRLPAGSNPASSDRPSRYLAALVRDLGVSDATGLIVAGRDYSGRYRYCRACHSYTERGAGVYRVEMAHGKDCEVAMALGARRAGR